MKGNRAGREEDKMKIKLCTYHTKYGEEIVAEKDGDYIIIKYGEKELKFNSIIEIEPTKVAAALSGIDFEKEGLHTPTSEWKVKPSEILELKFRIQPKPLIFQGNGKVIEVIAEDGCRINAAQLFFKHSDEVVVGEIFWALCRVQNEGTDEEGLQTFLPFIAYTKFKDKRQVKVDVQPLFFVKNIEVGGRLVSLSLDSNVSAPLRTMISLDAIQILRDQNFSITWKDTYEMVKGEIKRFLNLDFDPKLYDVVACWTIATYFVECFSAFPFLYFYGSSGAGKSRALMTTVYLSHRGFIVTDPSDASFYRTSEAMKPCMGIDESIVGQHVWKLVRTAFKRGISVPRLEKRGKREEFVVMLFETYMPVVFAATERPTELGGKDADESRIVFVFMIKENDPIGRDPEAEDFKHVRDKLYLLRLTKIVDLLDMKEEIEKIDLGLYGHERECWIPLLTVGKLVGEDVFNNLLNYAYILAGIQSETLHYEEKLVIRAIEIRREILAGKDNVDSFTPSELIEHLKTALNERGEFDEKRFEKHWSSVKVGRILSKMGLFRKRTGKSRMYYVDETTLNQLKIRYNMVEKQNQLVTVQSVTEKKVSLKNSLHETKASDGSDGCDGKNKQNKDSGTPLQENLINDGHSINCNLLSKKEDNNLLVQKQASQPSHPSQVNHEIRHDFSDGIKTGDSAIRHLNDELKDRPPSSELRKTCSDCRHWKTNSCGKHLEWVTLTPLHPACEDLQNKTEDERP